MRETWQASATASLFTYHGTREDCEKWMALMQSQEIFIMEDGKPRAIGVVTVAQAKSLPR